MIAYNIVCVMERVTVGDRVMERIIVEGGMQSARCDHVHVDLLQTSHVHSPNSWIAWRRWATLAIVAYYYLITMKRLMYNTRAAPSIELFGKPYSVILVRKHLQYRFYFL